jgi:hypothetical protein
MVNGQVFLPKINIFSDIILPPRFVTKNIWKVVAVTVVSSLFTVFSKNDATIEAF